MTEITQTIQILMQTDLFDPHKFNSYLILGYFVMWLIVMAYFIILANKQKSVREEIALMKQLLEEDEEKELA